MQKLLIEVTQQDQIYVEDECTTKGETLSSFFKKMLEDYKNKDSLKPLGIKPIETDKIENQEVKKKGRKKKTLPEIKNFMKGEHE